MRLCNLNLNLIYFYKKYFVTRKNIAQNVKQRVICNVKKKSR